MDAITVIHKFIRSELFDVSRKLSAAGPEDVAATRAAVAELAALLHGHAAQEDTRLAPLLDEIDGALARRMHDDHARLSSALDAIQERLAAHSVDSAALQRVYLDWNQFVSDYLAHLDAEERSLFPALGPQLPPIAAVAAGARAQPAAERAAFLDKLWAIVTAEERSAIERVLDVRVS